MKWDRWPFFQTPLDFSGPPIVQFDRCINLSTTAGCSRRAPGPAADEVEDESLGVIIQHKVEHQSDILICIYIYIHYVCVYVLVYVSISMC